MGEKMIAYKPKPFNLRGIQLPPGDYLIQIEDNRLLYPDDKNPEPNHVVNLYEKRSGNEVGWINLYYALPSETQVCEYSRMSIDSIALFDDKVRRFSQFPAHEAQEYKDPALLLHIGVNFDMKEWIGDDWDPATETDHDGSRTVLVFSKDLTRFEQDPDVYRMTLEHKVGRGLKLPYSIERNLLPDLSIGKDI